MSATHVKTDFLFPTIINRFFIENSSVLNLSETYSKILNLKGDVTTTSHEILPDSYTTSDQLHLNNNFSEEVKILSECFKVSLDSMAIQYDDIDMTGMWANFSGPNQIYNHNTHSHPNSFLSCAFYINVPPSNKNIISFEDPRAVRDYTIPNYRDDIDSPEKYNANWFDTVTGLILVFPSWLKHSVPPSIWNSDYRVVISANIVPISDCKRFTMKSNYRKP
jgi:uncharacterized protein (TIGR02466 family)